MASLRPASRLFSRQFTRITTQPAVSQAARNTFTPLAKRPVIVTPVSIARLHTSRTLFEQKPNARDDEVRGAASRRPRPDDQPSKKTTPSDPASNDAYPDGAPGEPKQGESLPSGIAPSTVYSFEDMRDFSGSPSSYPNKLLIDVREPSELLQTGRIPNAVNIPIGSAPDSFFLNAEDFEDKYGFDKPTQDKEVIFYCKAGVRSRTAARLAAQSGFGGKFGEFPGSFLEWEKKGGPVQKE